MQFLDRKKPVNRPFVLLLKCPDCGKLSTRTDPMQLWDIKLMWKDLVYQKDLINAQDINLCCESELEYYIGEQLAREVLFPKKGK